MWNETFYLAWFKRVVASPDQRVALFPRGSFRTEEAASDNVLRADATYSKILMLNRQLKHFNVTQEMKERESILLRDEWKRARKVPFLEVGSPIKGRIWWSVVEQQTSLGSFGFLFCLVLSSDDGESEFLPKWPLKRLILDSTNCLGSFTSHVNILTSSVEADRKHLAPDVPADTSLCGSVKFSRT